MSHRSDEGSGLIEYLFGTVFLLLPLLYLALALSELQAASYATGSAASALSREFSLRPDGSPQRAETIIRLAFEDFGLPPEAASVDRECEASCLEGGTLVTVRVNADVALPGIPWFLAEAGIGTIRISSAHADVIAPQE